MKKVFVLGLILSLGLMVSCTNNSTAKVNKEMEEAREEAIIEALREFDRKATDKAIKEAERKILEALKDIQTSIENQSMDNEEIRIKEDMGGNIYEKRIERY